MIITDYLTNYFKYGIWGNSLRIDAANACQLRCPSCHQAKEGESSFTRKQLKFESFKKFVDQYPTFKNIELSDNGEIFLNPELEEIIRYAYVKKIALTVRNGVNLNYASPKALEYLVKYKVRLLLISIDGATNETYQIYRKRGDLKKVLGNIGTINRFKQQFRSKYPVLIWQFIVFGHNEHEIPLARTMAKNLNMRFFLKFNIDEGYAPVTDSNIVKRELGFASIAEYEDKTNNAYLFACHQLWLEPQIGPEGDLLGCCHNNKENVYGNVFESGLRNVLRSEKFIYAKKMLLGQKEAREDIPCTQCSVYKNMRSRKSSIFSSFVALLGRLIKTHL